MTMHPIARARLVFAVLLGVGLVGCASGPQPIGGDAADSADGGASTDSRRNPASAAARLVAPDTDAPKREDIIAQCQMLEAPENAECEAGAYDGFEHKTDIEDPLP